MRQIIVNDFSAILQFYKIESSQICKTKDARDVLFLFSFMKFDTMKKIMIVLNLSLIIEYKSFGLKVDIAGSSISWNQIMALLGLERKLP